MPALSLGSSPRPKNTSVFGSQRRTNRESVSPRNWICGCKPGLLGPPISPIPPEIRMLVENLAAGPPTWLLSQNYSGYELNLTWPMNNGKSLEYNHYQKPFLCFPAVLLTVIGSLNCPPASWSIEDSTSTLTCHLCWSPDSLADDANDSGYDSPDPASPDPAFPDTARPSAIPLDLSLNSNTSDLPNSPASPAFCCQPSNDCSKHTSDAATETLPPVSTVNATTGTPSTALSSIACQTSRLNATASTSTQDLLIPPTSTNASSQTDPLPSPKPTTSKKSRKSRSKPKPYTTTSPSSADASTTYEPPPRKPVICRFCGENVPPDTPPLAHLFGCEDGPIESQQLRDGLLNDFAETTGIQHETLGTMIELHLTKYRPDEIEPNAPHTSHSDFLIGQLLFRSIDYDTLQLLHDNLTHVCNDYTTRTCKELHSDSLVSLYRSYPDITKPNQPSLEDLNKELDSVRYHPFDDLVEYPTEDDLSEPDEELYVDYF